LPRAGYILPNLGKNDWNLPNIGKTSCGCGGSPGVEDGLQTDAAARATKLRGAAASNVADVTYS
jgi:hypothetical protein